VEIIDISWPITPDMTAYKDRPMVTYTHIKEFSDQHRVRESMITLGSHTGTHVDAPAHFLRDGSTIDQVSLDRVIGPCKVFDFPESCSIILKVHLERYVIEKDDIILLKTANSNRTPIDLFDAQFVYLDAQAAQYLSQKSIKAIGIDYLGIERNNPLHETHRICMDSNITIIEGLRLAHVQPGEYLLCCLPLYIVGLEAAPARAVLIRD
jgi:arylformamidase